MRVNNGIVRLVKYGFVLVSVTAGVVLWVWQSQAAQDAERAMMKGDVRVIEDRVLSSIESDREILRELKAINSDLSQMRVSVENIRTTQVIQSGDIRDLKTDVRELRRRSP